MFSYQLSTTLQQDVCNDGVSICTGVCESTVSGVGLGMDVGRLLDQILDNVDMAFLRCFHEWC